MLKNFLISAGIVKNEEEFKEVMEATTAIIKSERLSLGKKTNMLDIVLTADIVANTFKRCTHYIA